MECFIAPLYQSNDTVSLVDISLVKKFIITKIAYNKNNETFVYTLRPSNGTTGMSFMVDEQYVSQGMQHDVKEGDRDDYALTEHEKTKKSILEGIRRKVEFSSKDNGIVQIIRGNGSDGARAII